jgi:hypothetical protein
MPTNLNALIRYKQIDLCLRNPYTRCTLEKLQEVCSEALGEHRGIYKTVSKRTIQDDIRVMRSDILGFNAPIVLNDGAYIYEDKDFSIFDTPITEKELLLDIFRLLLKERENLADDMADNLLKRISLVLGENLELNERRVIQESRELDLENDSYMKEEPLTEEQEQELEKELEQNQVANKFGLKNILKVNNNVVSFFSTDIIDFLKSTEREKADKAPGRSEIRWSDIFNSIN